MAKLPQEKPKEVIQAGFDDVKKAYKKGAKTVNDTYAVNATMFDRYLPFSCPLNTFVTDAVRFAPFHHH